MADSEKNKKRIVAKWAVIVQGLCGLLAIACGVALVLLEPTSDIRYGSTMNVLANTGYGIWGGVVLTLAALYAYYYRERETTNQVSLYAVVTISSLGIALVLLVIAGWAFTEVVRPDEYKCDGRGLIQTLYDESEHPCCYLHRSCPLGESQKCQELADIIDPIVDSFRSDCLRRLYANMWANIAVYACMLVASAIATIISLYSVVIAITDVCSECRDGAGFKQFDSPGQNDCVVRVVGDKMISPATNSKMASEAAVTLAAGSGGGVIKTKDTEIPPATLGIEGCAV